MEIKKIQGPQIPQEITESQQRIQQSSAAVGSSKDELVPFQANIFQEPATKVSDPAAEVKELLSELLSTRLDSSKPLTSEEAARRSEIKEKLSQLLTSHIAEDKFLEGLEDVLNDILDQLPSRSDILKQGGVGNGSAGTNLLDRILGTRSGVFGGEDPVADSPKVLTSAEDARRSEIKEKLSQILTARLESSDPLISREAAQRAEIKEQLSKILSDFLNPAKPVTSGEAAQLAEIKEKLSQILTSRLADEELAELLEDLLDDLADQLPSRSEIQNNRPSSPGERILDLLDRLSGTTTNEPAGDAKPVLSAESERISKLKQLLESLLQK